VESLKMKKSLLVLAVVAAFAPVLAQAEAGDFVVRLRATHVSPDESSKLGAQTDATLPAGTLHTLQPGTWGAGVVSSTALYGGTSAALQVDSNTIPEIDISYYITKNIAAELILAVGTRHDVSVSGTGGAVAHNLGSVNLLPPTLSIQWHFNPDQTIDPYVGAGVSYVRAMDRNLTAATGLGNLPIHIERNSFGPAIQAGFDYNLENKWLINFDVKKIWFGTDVTLDTTAIGSPGWKKIDSLDIDPWVVSVGFGKKF
jgi:outer membrane protein